MCLEACILQLLEYSFPFPEICVLVDIKKTSFNISSLPIGRYSVHQILPLVETNDPLCMLANKLR